MLDIRCYLKYTFLAFLTILIITVGYPVVKSWIIRPEVSYINSKPIDVLADPIQTGDDLPGNIKITRRGGSYSLNTVARYRISGKVVSKNNYRSGWESSLSPMDLAIVWNVLAVGNNSKSIRFRQVHRWVKYRLKKDSPYSISFINRNSSNNHIIPSNSNVRAALNRVRKNDIIELQGYLVNVNGTYRNRRVSWRTSLTRTDTGSGACEIIYVTSVKRGDKVFE